MDLHADHNLPIPHPAFDEFGFHGRIVNVSRHRSSTRAHWRACGLLNASARRHKAAAIPRRAGTRWNLARGTDVGC